MTVIRSGYVWITAPEGGFMPIRRVTVVDLIRWKFFGLSPTPYK